MTGYLLPALSPERQLGLLRLRYPQGKGTYNRGRMTWRSSVRPTPLSRDYTVRVTYEAQGLPDVFVEDPDLKVLADGKRIPHLYDQATVRLCLWLPSSGQWNSRLSIADTVVPWTALWLYYFEDWLTCGEWRGGGEHPEQSDEQEDS